VAQQKKENQRKVYDGFIRYVYQYWETYFIIQGKYRCWAEKSLIWSKVGSKVGMLGHSVSMTQWYVSVYSILYRTSLRFHIRNSWGILPTVFGGLFRWWGVIWWWEQIARKRGCELSGREEYALWSTPYRVVFELLRKESIPQQEHFITKAAFWHSCPYVTQWMEGRSRNRAKSDYSSRGEILGWPSTFCRRLFYRASDPDAVLECHLKPGYGVCTFPKLPGVASLHCSFFCPAYSPNKSRKFGSCVALTSCR